MNEILTRLTKYEFTGVFLFLAVVIFGSNCYRRDWLMYPSFNVVSWSFAFAVVAFIFFGKIVSLVIVHYIFYQYQHA